MSVREQRDFSCPRCQFDPDDSLVMCEEHDRLLKPLSVETLRMMVIDSIASLVTDTLDRTCPTCGGCGCALDHTDDKDGDVTHSGKCQTCDGKGKR